jgi:hypothetical protein
MRRFGLTVDNLVAVELVTADAERLRVDAETEPELFWGLRGGGGNFGIAAAFEYRLHPVGPMVLGGPIFWPLADGPEVLGFLRDFAARAPDELGLAMFLRLAPPGPLVPPDWYGRPVLGVVPIWTGDPAAGERAVAPLRRVARPVADMVRPLPYLFLQSMVDAANQHGMHYYWRSQRLPELADGAVDAVVGLAEAITSPLSYAVGLAMGGAAGGSTPTPPPSASAATGSSSASWPAGRHPTPPPSATWAGCARAGRPCAPTAPASTRTSSPTRARPASRPPTAGGWDG